MDSLHDHACLYCYRANYVSKLVKIGSSLSEVVYIIQFQFNSYVYFRHKKSICYKIYIQLDKIYIMIYSNAIRFIRTKKSGTIKKTYL